MQKRNVWIRYAFRYALLALLERDLVGTMVVLMCKKRVFSVFQGTKYTLFVLFRHHFLLEITLNQAVGEKDVKKEYAFRFYQILIWLKQGDNIIY